MNADQGDPQSMNSAITMAASVFIYFSFFGFFAFLAFFSLLVSSGGKPETVKPRGGSEPAKLMRR
jgi:hypothetical protein